MCKKKGGTQVGSHAVCDVLRQVPDRRTQQAASTCDTLCSSHASGTDKLKSVALLALAISI